MTDRELDARVGTTVFSLVPIRVNADMEVFTLQQQFLDAGDYYIVVDGGIERLPDYSTTWNGMELVVEKIHLGINPAEMGTYQYLTLVCVSTYGEPWAASFDFNLSHDWYEADIIVSYPFAARATTAPLAICRAALKVVS